MKLSQFKTALLAALFASASMGAFATDDDSGKDEMHNHKGAKKGHERMMERMHEMDANKDGFIDKDEYMKNAERKWSKMDKSGAGKVSLKEMEEKHKERMKERAERMKEHKSDRDDDTSKE